MDLVPVSKSKGEKESEIPSIKLSDRAREVARVQTAEAKRQPLSRKIETFGHVEIAKETMTNLTTWVRGRVEKLYIDSRGEHIRRGQRIARLYSPKLESVQKELVQALETMDRAKADGKSTRVKSARSAVDAIRSQLRVLGMNQSQIQKLSETREVHETVNIYAEAGGMVHHLNVAEGDWLKAEASIATVHSHEVGWIQLAVYTEDLPFVSKGVPVTVSFPKQPGRTIEDRVDFIDPHVNPRNGTVNARVVVGEPKLKLRPGTEIEARIESSIEGKPDPLSVPESAILWTGKRSVVYVENNNEQPPLYTPKTVELGPKAGDRRVIEKGLEPGDSVVINGAYQIDAELQIQGQPTMMTGLSKKGGHAHDHDHGAASSSPVELPAEGKEFKPGIDAKRVPDDAWYCPMDPVHWAQPDKGDGSCPVCGMNLKHKNPSNSKGKTDQPDSGPASDSPEPSNNPPASGSPEESNTGDETAASSSPGKLPPDGKRFEPPVKPGEIPAGAWYCPMDTVHFAQPDKGDGSCPVCGMNLEKKQSSKDSGTTDDSAASSSPVDVSEDGEKFEPAINPERLPAGVWYCPMEKTHWAQRKKGDGECPVCGMFLNKKSADGDKGKGHNHGAH
jgi:Cu(I)/Ag(I) efflux system membrane fusion protein